MVTETRTRNPYLAEAMSLTQGDPWKARHVARGAKVFEQKMEARNILSPEQRKKIMTSFLESRAHHLGYKRDEFGHKSRWSGRDFEGC